MFKPSDKHKVRGFINDNGSWSVVWKLPDEADPEPPLLNREPDDAEGIPVPVVEPVVGEGPVPAKAVVEEVPVPEPIVPNPAGQPMQIPAFGSDAQNNVTEVQDDPSEQRDHQLPSARQDEQLSVELTDKQLPPQQESVGELPEEPRQEINNEIIVENFDDENNDFNCSLDPADLKPLEAIIEPEKEKGNSKVEDKIKNVDAGMSLLEDEFYNSNPEHLASEVFPNESFLIIEEDSDKDEEDEDQYTTMRLRNQVLRYRNRKHFNIQSKLHESPGNKDFVEECVKFCTENTTDEDPDCSTVSYVRGLLFEQSDCFLQFMVSKDESFSLERLLDFSNETRFLEVKCPLEWVSSISGADGRQQPTRRREMLKCHRR